MEPFGASDRGIPIIYGLFFRNNERNYDMKLIAIPLVLCMVVGALGGPSTNDSDKTSWEPDDLFLRTGIFLDGIPAERPEDKLYPVADNLYKLDEYQRLHGIRLEARDLPRLERAYRQSGRSDGVFNVPDGISRGDEWDAKTYTVAKRNENGELVPLSRTEVTRSRMDARPYARMSVTALRAYTTLGQLAKQCDGIFIGELASLNMEHARLQFQPEFLLGELGLTFRVETNLLGNLSSREAVFTMRWWESKTEAPKVGTRMMVFYARGFVFDLWNHSVNEFDQEKPIEKRGVPPVVPNGSSGLRILDSSEAEKVYIEAVGGYLRLLRREERNPDKYYEFLRSLVKSPVWRIRQDAKEDLLKFWGRRGPEQFDLTRVLDDPELDWDLGKDYVRYVAIPGREKRKAEQQKQE
jgi:hypothetical protein